MSTSLTGGRYDSLAGASAAPLPLRLWTGAAVLAMAALSVASAGLPDAAHFADSDDAVRMLQVRELLRTGAWFDLTLPSLGGADPLVSHWSRLVDLPLALLMSLLSLVAAPDQAELGARVVWPLALFGALAGLVARAAEEKAGRPAALIALVLTVLCFSGTVQFAPGRIDHHNVMILAAVGGTLLLVHAVRHAQAGWSAGLLLGLGTAVGYEGLLLTAAALCATGLVAVASGAGRPGVRRAVTAFALSISVAFFATISPGSWSTVTCDALSLNVVLLSTTAAAGLVATLHLRPRPSLEVRLAALAAAAITALAVFAAVEPACLKGPFGQLDRDVWPIWLDHVRETNGILWLAATLPLPAAVYVMHAAICSAAAIAVFRRDRDWGTLLLAVLVVISSLLSLWQVKLMPYAALLGIPLLAVWIARFTGSAGLSAGMGRLAGAVLLNQHSMLAMGALLMGAGGSAAQDFTHAAEGKAGCLAARSVAPLAALPKGLIVADVDAGPFIAARSEHRVLAGPYHRLDRQIIETHQIFYTSLEEAHARLRRAGAKYVVTCEAMADSGLGAATAPRPDSLKPSLIAGRVPDFLEPVPLAGPTPLRVWRLK